MTRHLRLEYYAAAADSESIFFQTSSAFGDPLDLSDHPHLLDIFSLGHPQLRTGLGFLFSFKVSFEKHLIVHSFFSFLLGQDLFYVHTWWHTRLGYWGVAILTVVWLEYGLDYMMETASGMGIWWKGCWKVAIYHNKLAEKKVELALLCESSLLRRFWRQL